MSFEGSEHSAKQDSSYHQSVNEDSRILRNRWRWRRRSIFTVLQLDLRSHFLEAFAFIHHLHHVTRDAYADPSGQAHSIEL